MNALVTAIVVGQFIFIAGNFWLHHLQSNINTLQDGINSNTIEIVKSLQKQIDTLRQRNER